MRVQEVKKCQAEIKRGLVMMAIEGSEQKLDTVERMISYTSTKCRDAFDTDMFADYYMIRRDQKSDFMAEYKRIKITLK